MEGKTISVVMPAYNAVRTLEESVRSVLAQTDPDWELIVLDDCSTDDTWALIEQLAALDSRIRPVRNERNCGVGLTRNRGVSLARGDWVAFLDSDDLWTPDKLSKQRALLERYPETGLFYTGSGFLTAAGEKLDYVLHVPETIERRELLKQNLISCSSVLAKRELLLRCPMESGRNLHEDFVAWLRILETEPVARGLDEPLLLYRRAENSKSSNKLHAAKMNWNAYRAAGLGVPERLYYMLWYALRGVKKYTALRRAGTKS